MKLLKIGRLVLLAVALLVGALTGGLQQAKAAPTTLTISWSEPEKSEANLARAIGDAGIWTFNVAFAPDCVLVGAPIWEYPTQKICDRDWGVWGEDGSTLSWSAPNTGGEFTVKVRGRIRHVVQGNGGGGGTVEEKDFSATWDGEMEGPCPVSMGHKDVKIHSVLLTWKECVDAPEDFGGYTLYGPYTDEDIAEGKDHPAPDAEHLLTSIGDQCTKEQLASGLEPSTTYYFILQVSHCDQLTTLYQTVQTPDIDVLVEVRRKEADGDTADASSMSWTTSATAVVGGKDSFEHLGFVKVTVKDLEGNPIVGQAVSAVTDSEGQETTGTLDAIVNLAGVTDANGVIYGSYKSGNRVEPTKIEIDAGQGGSSPPTASVAQVWNELEGSLAAWEYAPYFTPGDSSPITYIMTADGGRPIRFHDVDFITKKLTGLEWDATLKVDWDGDGITDYTGDYVPNRSYRDTDPELASGGKYAELVIYHNPHEETDSGGAHLGRYTADQEVNDYEGPEGYIDYFVDSVDFEVQDNDALEKSQ